VETQCFDAIVDFTLASEKEASRVLLRFRGIAVQASLHFYNSSKGEKLGETFVQVLTSHPITVKWKDGFKVQKANSDDLLGEGTVLNPFSQKVRKSQINKRVAFLGRLTGGEKEMVIALGQERGIEGLPGSEISEFSSLSQKAQLNLALELESEGKVKILIFSPLMIVTQTSFDFLSRSVLAFIESKQKKNMDFIGISENDIWDKFESHPKMLALSLKYLERSGKVRRFDDRIVLADFKMVISPQEEKLLLDMEALCLQGEFQSASLQEIQKRYHLSADKLDRMLSLLVERKKIIKGKDGFLLHAKWLDDIITKIRVSGHKELSVGDFKKMTGLSRRYAIAVLELLDQMKVTRRVGPMREIL
jgi:selenocysteine-specific elongation factor